MKSSTTTFAVVGVVCIAAFQASAQRTRPPVRSATELATLVEERANVAVELPDVGYSWADEDLTGDTDSGSLAATHSKVIYYFVHWGPIEIDTVDEDYVRQRIPKLWPNEGLEVGKVEAATVAGHPAIYAEAVPKRQFYRAFFLIWNCPETGRQFIADMNYNVAVKTPRSELEAELETTRKTLACHPGAPVTHLESHPIRFDCPAYGFSFDHPVHWFVFDNPYGVPHPSYAGFRDRSVGSVLAWMQDMEVTLRFDWSPIHEKESEAGESMGVQLDLYEAAVERALASDRVLDFQAEEYEALRLGSTPMLKVVGTAEMQRPDIRGSDFIPRKRLMMLVATDAEKSRLLVITVGVDFHLENGILLPPHRSILDRWAVEISRELAFQ